CSLPSIDPSHEPEVEMSGSWSPVRRGMPALALFYLAACTSSAAEVTEVAIDPDDIGGVVMGPSGPEAGVWVIAETSDLPTRFAKIVVTDDAGRYLVPDLPE